MRQGGDLIQQEASDLCAGRARDDRVLEDSGSVPHRGQDGSGLALNYEGWAAR